MRVATIDVARGAAMLFVCLAHFGDGLGDYRSGVSAQALGWMGRVAMVATPTFVIISGLTLGLVLKALPRQDAQAFKLKLVDRCLFTLTIGHLLLVLAEGSLVGHFRRELGTVFITDIVSLSTLAGLFLQGRVRVRLRLLLAVASFVGGWLLWVWWHPAVLSLQLLKEVLVGPTRGHILSYGFPLLQWFGVHQAASLAGERAAQTAFRNERRLAISMGAIGLGMITLALALRGLGITLRGAGVLSTSVLTTVLTSLSQKLPPSPAYVAFHGGVGLSLVSLLVLSAGMVSTYLRRGLAVVGRSSLATYIAQYFVFSTLVPLLALPVHGWWPAYFVPLLAVTFLLSLAWDRHCGNRWLTLGLPAGRNGAAGAVS